MTKRAVLIGINYKGSDGELRGCVNDINNIQKVLVEQYHYRSSDIRVLTEEVNKISPTRSNIETNLKWLVSGVRPGDTLLFYYSGHGSYTQDASGEEADKQDEVLVPLDFDTKGGITDDWLFNNVVRRVPRKVTLWGFTDCCHSGTLLDLKYNYKSMCELKSGQQPAEGQAYAPQEWTDKFTMAIERSKDVQGNVFLFSGCHDSQTSADAYIAETFQGAFSHSLLETIKSHNAVPAPALALAPAPKTRGGVQRTKQVERTRRVPSADKKKHRSKPITVVVKNRTMLKDIWCRLVLNGFKGQDCQFSCSRPALFEGAFNI